MRRVQANPSLPFVDQYLASARRVGEGEGALSANRQEAVCDLSLLSSLSAHTEIIRNSYALLR